MALRASTEALAAGGREQAGLDPGPQDHQRNAVPLRPQELWLKLKAQGWKQVAPPAGLQVEV